MLSCVQSAAVTNLLLIVVDCLRADVVARGRGAWPRVSALAAGGARFSACYSTCPTTTPAVTAILTGRYPSTHGVQGLRGTQLRDSIPTAAEQLGRGGVATWCSATGPLLDTVGTFRGFADAEYRDVPRRSVHSEWGGEAIAQIAHLAPRRDAVLRARPPVGRAYASHLPGPVRVPRARPQCL